MYVFVQRCAVEFEVKAFCAENQDEKAQKRWEKSQAHSIHYQTIITPPKRTKPDQYKQNLQNINCMTKSCIVKKILLICQKMPNIA